MDKKKSFLESSIFLKLFFVFSFVFLFLNLGNIYLWHDEASTAMLGKSILNYGYPSAYDGKNWLFASFQRQDTTDGTGNFEKGLAWTTHTWLPYYMEAMSLWLFGYSTFSARIIFTLFGFLSLFLIYKLYNILYKSKKITNLALVILFASTFFFIFARQARYYSLTLFFTAGLLINYINMLKRDKIKDTILFAVCGALLFHSHYLPFFIAFVALTVHFLFFTKFKDNLGKMAFSFLIIAIFALPWLLYAQPWRFGMSEGTPSLLSLFSVFLFLLKSLNFHCPLILLVFLPVLLYGLNKKIKKQKDNSFSDRFVFVFVLIPVLAILFSSVKIYRYIFNFSPLFFLFYSRLFYICKEKTKKITAIAIIMLVLLLTSNLLSFIPVFLVSKAVTTPLTTLCDKFAPDAKTERCDDYISGALDAGQVKFPIFYYMYEITHDYDGPNEGIVKYLNENAKENEIVWAYFSGYYIQFYTDLRVMDPQEYKMHMNDTALKPDWIVYRRKSGDLAQPLVDYAKNNNYIPIALDYPDIYYENRENLISHRFWTASDAPKLIIYKKP